MINVTLCLLMSGNVLVGGGTGFIGSHLIKALRNKNYRVQVVSRRSSPETISWGELALKGLPRNTIGVVNLAGQNVMDFKYRWTESFMKQVLTSRINTTALLAKLINDAVVKPKMFATMSGVDKGVGVYKPDSKAEYTECSEVEPFDFFSQLVSQWEEAAQLDLETSFKCRVVNIRCGVVLGKDGGLIKQLYLPFFLGLGGPMGDGSQYLPWIHIQDLVELIIFSIENDKVTGVLNGVAPQICTNKEFSIAFAKALNRPALIPMPSFVFNIMLGPERAKMITEGQKVIPQRTQELGFKFSFPTIREACQNIVNKD